MIQLDNAVERYGKVILTELKEAGITCWLAGGALRDYFMGVPVHTDHDIFFPSEIEFEKAKVYFNAKDAETIFEGSNGVKVKYKGRKYDLINKYWPNPQQTIDAFDFTVSMFAVDDEKVYYGESTFIDLAKRQLMINKITYPASTISRAFRYYKKGFRMCAGEMKKMIEAVKGEEIPKPEQETDQPPSTETADFFRGID